MPLSGSPSQPPAQEGHCASGVSAAVCGRRASGQLTKRHAWLENEMYRLKREIDTLADENGSLAENLAGTGMPGVSRDQGGARQSRTSRPPLTPRSEGSSPRSPQKCKVRLTHRAGSMVDFEEEFEQAPPEAETSSAEGGRHAPKIAAMAGKVNTVVVKGSALSFSRYRQAFVYVVAFLGVLLVLILAAMDHHATEHGAHQGVAVVEIGGPGADHSASGSGGMDSGDHEDHLAEVSAEHDASSAEGATSSADHHVAGHADPDAVVHRAGGAHGGGHHRRLSGGGSGESEAEHTQRLMRSIAVSLTGCGLIALTVNLLNQPLILGYLLGGVLVGPIGLGIVQSHVDIAELSSLGLIFLLFMIGLELDVMALLKMGKVVLVTGALQFPICAGAMMGLFMGLESLGLSFGAGPYASMYCGMVCAISSTMVVVKLLGEKGEMDSQPGRLTIGILIFQDIWAIIVLAIQPNLANPEILGILKTFSMIAVLIAVSMWYAKFVMPAVLFHTSKNLELMLVMSLCWCFFICMTAVLPFVGLSMELASLIAGVALATFPYSAEFNGKIKYIRDFFITLFFAGLGMQIPVPSVGAIGMGVLVSVVVLIFRPVGIFLLVWMLGGGTRLATISTINLSQVSEFALVICSLGMGFGHIQGDTMVIIIWTFAILAIASSYMIKFNALIYTKLSNLVLKLRGKAVEHSEEHAHEHGGHRDIVLLGYHKVAFMLVAEVKSKSPQLLERMHVIDFNQSIMPKLRSLGLTCSYGDISSPDVLEHAFHGEPHLVVCTIPDSMLRGVTNEGLLKASKQVWPEARVIVTADTPEQAKKLYACGADYVVRMSTLCAERLHELLSQNRQQIFGGGNMQQVFEHFKNQDKESRAITGFIKSGSF